MFKIETIPLEKGELRLANEAETLAAKYRKGYCLVLMIHEVNPSNFQDRAPAGHTCDGAFECHSGEAGVAAHASIILALEHLLKQARADYVKASLDPSASSRKH